MEIREKPGKGSCEIHGQMAKQEPLLLERQRKHRVRHFVRVVLAKQFGCSVPASLGEQIAQLSKRLSHDDRNSLLQVERAPENEGMACQTETRGHLLVSRRGCGGAEPVGKLLGFICSNSTVPSWPLSSRAHRAHSSEPIGVVQSPRSRLAPSS